MNKGTKKIVMAAIIAAFACVATMIIKIPSPLKGYLNMGDCVVLVAGWMLTPLYGFMAAGIGSGLADIFSGYPTYAPATFLIKGSMALIVFFSYKLLRKRLGDVSSRIIGAVLAEVVMILGYFVFEGFLYGFAPSVVNIPANAAQGILGIIIGLLLIRVLRRFEEKW